MKILLIYPYVIEQRIYDEDIHAPPIGLYYVAALLKETGYDVEILNWHGVNKNSEIIYSTIREKRPDIIGFSILHANRWGAIEIAEIAKKINPESKIIFGGVGATFLWKHLLKNFSQIDFVVIGEGEYTLLNLVRQIEKEPDEISYKKIKGIAFRLDGQVVKNGDPEPIKDLDQLPIPAEYFEYNHVSSSRGCPWNCSFCGSPRFWGRRIRFRSPKNFVDELEHLYLKGVTFFYFSDDTFTINKERVIEICKDIVNRGLNIGWYAISRVTYVDDEILYWMRMAGCIQISYGVESGSEKIRRTLNKPLKADHIKRAFSATRKFGILPRAYFIYGSPGETWKTIQESIDLMKEIMPLSAIFYILDTFPGTELYERFQKLFNINDDIWMNKIEGIMYWEMDPQLSDQLILDFGKKLRTEFYSSLPGFVESITLTDKKEMYKRHADFCSRLGMTFSHGDYSAIETIEKKDKIAEGLYKKALKYHPDHRAYLGLGIVKQKNREFDDSAKILSEGLKHFPESGELSMCLGITYMNMGKFKDALSCFERCPDSPQVRKYSQECYHLMAS